MKNKLINILKYFVFWIFYFQVARLLFFIITNDHSSKFSIYVLIKSMQYGMWLDLSVAGYFTLLFAILNIVEMFFSALANRIYLVSNYVLLIFSTLIVCTNAILYTYWATPLDYNALKYLKTPTEALASINILNILLPIILCLFFWFLFSFLFKKLKIKISVEHRYSLGYNISQFVILCIICLLLILPIRGGVGIVPVNLSRVYFFKEIYPNHAAYNPIWNVLFSLTNTSKQNHYKFMSDKQAEQKYISLFTKSGVINESEKLLNTHKPNVVLIILESFLFDLFNYKYKNTEVIPKLNKIAAEGIFFTNFYASGDRSDKGLVSIYSAYPALPKSTIVQYPNKFAGLPSLFKDFKNQNYITSFYYGGNLDFANLRSYFISAKVGKIITENDFKGKLAKGKWGVHDEFTLDRFFNDIKISKQPFFTSLFTLSNHEPYDIPGDYFFGKSNGELEYLSSAKYTDIYIGKFIDSLKKTKLWENTLVIITADHGVTKLGINEMQVPSKFHIPMIWTGGAIKKQSIIDKICSQTDIPLMLLDQCGIAPKENYKFSNSIFRKDAVPFATYFFNNGFGFLRNNCVSIFDNVSLRYWTNTCNERENGDYGKAYLQVLSKDFNK